MELVASCRHGASAEKRRVGGAWSLVSKIRFPLLCNTSMAQPPRSESERRQGPVEGLASRKASPIAGD